MLKHVHACRGNDSPRSLNQSLGLMATFQYVPAHLEQFSFEYTNTGKTNVHANIQRLRQAP